jgi:hypothetical protein
MFGNAYVDFCLANYADLIALVMANSPAIKHLKPEAKMFATIYQFILSKKGATIPLADFAAIGADMQSLAFTVFIISFKQGNKAISMNETGVTYFGQ